jgi:hypothetical protein
MCVYVLQVPRGVWGVRALTSVPAAPDRGAAERGAGGPVGPVGRGQGGVLVAAGRGRAAGGRLPAAAHRDAGRGLRRGQGHRRVSAPVPPRALELLHAQRREPALRHHPRQR